MTPNSATPLLTGSIVRNGGNGIQKGVTPHEYHLTSSLSTAEYAAAYLAMRLRLTISTSREVCRMAGIGGRA